MIKYTSRIKMIFIVILLLSVSSIYGQHRGDSFAFQGLNDFSDNGVRATSMGGAVTALSGNVSMLFYNPAGLTNINGIQISASANYSSREWRENQNYRPNRFFVTLPFYLEGLYTPNPDQDGMYDYERLWTDDQLIDSSYVFNTPELGLDPFSEEAADWKKKNSTFVFNNFAAAFPFKVGDHEFTVAAAYNNTQTIEDFDRNDTYLDPHIGYSEYGRIDRVNGTDSLVMNWSNYYRESSGTTDNLAIAVSYKISEILNAGIGANLTWGSTDDLLFIKRVGTFHLMDQQRFKYWYTDVYDEVKGSSDYSTTRFNLGFQLDLEKFKVGVKVDLPYTLKKEWDYTTSYKDSISSNISSTKGIDELEIPAVFNFGITYNPIENFLFSIDYEYAPFSEAKFKFENPNTVYSKMPDRHTIRFGAEYSPIDLISIRAGYRDIPSVFIPDGAAIKTSGPSTKSYTFGLGFNTPYGKFDIAYDYRYLRYYDSYYSNTNYNTLMLTNLLFAYTIEI
ncbi:MAG: outer membrane protein transport protein [Melioribacteraceae bacterium]|nr:outer membrane protein transport protein [Melioribacteraceae bacterium]